MQKITLADSTVKLEECSLVSWTIGAVANPFTGQPLTASQAFVFGSVALVGGVAIGTAYGKSISKKLGIRTKDGELLQSTSSSGQAYNSYLA